MSQVDQQISQEHLWAMEDDHLAQQCEDHDPWTNFWEAYPKKTRKFSDMGLLVAMFLCMSSAMLRIKAR
jgi:hypothetical protein